MFGYCGGATSHDRNQLDRAVAPRLELVALMAYERPLPSLENYDHLLSQEVR